MKALLLCALVILLCAFGFSSKEKTYKDFTYTSRELRRQPANVQMPASLWEKVEAFGRTAGGLAADAEVVTEFVGLKAFLIEKNRGILNRENFELKFPVGGGELDLAEFLSSLKGSFYFMTEFMPDADAKMKKVYYLSNSPERTLLGAKVGAGCDAYYDVSTAFAKAVKTPGFLVNTTDGRHVGALAGTYFFVGFEDGKLRIASLVVSDTRFRSLQCRHD